MIGDELRGDALAPQRRRQRLLPDLDRAPGAPQEIERAAQDVVARGHARQRARVVPVEAHGAPGETIEIRRVEFRAAVGAEQVAVQAVEQHDDGALRSRRGASAMRRGDLRRVSYHRRAAARRELPSASNALASVGVYRREVHASLERIWENVLDWEHLPWLHRESFSRIECLQAGTSGWRARVGLAPARPSQEILLELALERPALRYVARTLEGPGSGTEIWTRLRAGFARAHADRGRVPAAGHPAGAAATRSGAPTSSSTRCCGIRTQSMMTRREAQLAARVRSEPARPLRSRSGRSPRCARACR